MSFESWELTGIVFILIATWTVLWRRFRKTHNPETREAMRSIAEQIKREKERNG